MVNPTHSVLAVFGDVDPAKAKARIEEKFAGWSGAPVVKTLPEETRQVKENRLVEIKNEKNSAALFIGTNGLEVNNSERPVLDVISSILSGGGSPAGRIFDALRGGETNLVYAVHAFPFYGKNAGFFGVLTQTTMGNLDKVQQIIMANLKGLADEPVPANELERSKEAMLVGQKLGRETLDAQASSEWRIRMWKNVLPEIPQNLFVGKGYLFSSTDDWMYQFKGGEEGARGSELVGDYHNGPLSVILPFGLPGVLTFCWFLFACGRALYRNYKFSIPEYRIINTFLFAYFVARVIFFFAVFGSLYSDLAMFTGIVGLSVSLNGGVSQPEAEPAPQFVFGERNVPAEAEPQPVA